MARGKSMNLFLIDGDVGGRIKCTLANWTGIAYKIPRTELENSKDREDLKQSGVYFLFGTSDNTNENIVYVGQAGARRNGEGLLNRLLEHKRNPDKDYWTEVVVLTTSNNSFGPTEISYLENRFCNLAKSANRFIVKNGNTPNSGNLTEEKESEMEEFIENALVMMGTLGYRVFVPLNEVNVEHDDSLLYFERKSNKSGEVIKATCRQTNEGFVVLKGSMIEVIDSDDLTKSMKAAREKASINSENILQEDVLFRNPSHAASFVRGGSTDGYKHWKTAEGKTLLEVEKG